ncbi:MAG: PepSY-like domain-containing protein [Archangium sp.]
MKTNRLVLLAVLTASFLAVADDKEVKVGEADVPKPVLEALNQRFPTATARTFEKEKGQYEVSFEVKDGARLRKLSLDLSEKGEVLSEEEVIAFEELPAPVQAAFRASKFAKAKVDLVERETKAGKTTFEVEVTAAEGKRELVFDSSGTLIKTKN